jgi:hypothetical protein
MWAGRKQNSGGGNSGSRTWDGDDRDSGKQRNQDERQQHQQRSGGWQQGYFIKYRFILFEALKN